MFCWPLLLRGAIRQDLIWNYPSYAKHPRIFSSLLPLNCEILLRNQQPAYTAPSSTRLDRREGIRAWDGNHACTPIILYFNKVPILSSRQNYGLGLIMPFILYLHLGYCGFGICNYKLLRLRRMITWTWCVFGVYANFNEVHIAQCRNV